MLENKKEKTKRRHKRVRKKIFGTADRPRLHVFRSLNHIYAQLVDDKRGVTILAEDDRKKESGKKKSTGEKSKTEKAFEVGNRIAKKAKEKKIKTVVFDRGGYRYHGRVKAVAEGARKEGLEF